MSFMFRQPSRLEESQTLLQRVECVHDIICYNVTHSLGDKFRRWLEKHEALLKRLRRMVDKETKSSLKGKNGRRTRKNPKVAS
jgi:hypothetical protein